MSGYAHLGYGTTPAPAPGRENSWYVRRGRIDRATYWLHHALPMWAVSVAAVAADLALGTAWYSASSSGGPYSYGYEASFSGGLVTLLVSVALLAPSISAVVTRLHDTGRSAWFLLWGLVPFAGPVVLFVVVGCLAGDPGPNRYGDAGRRPVRRETLLAAR
jgi:uncharacterized membrane protein YhaH (DUF805 family)